MERVSHWLKLSLPISAVMMVVVACSTGSPLLSDDVAEIDGVPVQSDEDARAMDIELAASGSGMSVEAIERAVAFQEAFDTYALEVLEQYPGQISMVYVDPAPATKGYIQFVDEVPTALSRADSSLLARGTLSLTGNGGISLDDQEKRAVLAADALVELGYKNHVTFFDHQTRKIKVELQLPKANGVEVFSVSNLKTELQSKIADAAKSQLQGLAAQVNSSDIDLEIIRRDGPIVQPTSTHGGQLLRDGSFGECSSGWTVSGTDGDGLITAGHCTGLDTVQRRGGGAGLTHRMSFRNQCYVL